ncbi:MAG: hypothetical protein ACKPKO_25335 [Candidatus Fonsibacter sp.]
MVGLQHLLGRNNIEPNHKLNKRQLKLVDELQKKHNGILKKDWYGIDTGFPLKWESCLNGKFPMSLTFTGVRTLLAQVLPVPYSGRAWALEGLPSSVTLHMKEA